MQMQTHPPISVINNPWFMTKPNTALNIAGPGNVFFSLNALWLEQIIIVLSFLIYVFLHSIYNML